ncbi:MAG: ribbon-helix-helix domain-containing protein [Thaumarchaeota archaeon]|nr:ribbon-helix-helix domain-containing protein [Candidatus Calditenuaceae archaeon]MDW8186947.1 ribbon-helix-helix domain-containing protein [Nitrososphaerota archaeon]
MTDTVLLQVRVSASLLRRVDELCAEGLFKNRSDAVNDALRYLVLRYSRTSPEGKLTSLYLGGRLARSGSPSGMIFRSKREVEVEF